jgi:hypothetical protein
MRAGLAILMFLTLATPALAALTRGDEAAVLAAPARTHLDTRVAQLPPAVRAAFPNNLAEPGAPFQVTDVVPGRPLPGARMVWGARVGRLYLLHLERGGIAHYYLVEAYDLTGGPGGPTRRVWRAHAHKLASFADFQAAYRAHRLTEMN